MSLDGSLSTRKLAFAPLMRDGVQCATAIGHGADRDERPDEDRRVRTACALVDAAYVEMSAHEELKTLMVQSEMDEQVMRIDAFSGK